MNRASEAKERTEAAQTEEQTALSTYEDYIYEYTSEIEVEQVTDTNPGALEGSGTETEPYVINSIEDLVFFAYDVTNGNNYEGEYVSLGLSLDFNSTKSYVDAYRTNYGTYGYEGELKTLLTTGEGFIPIGTIEGDETGTTSFAGIFDGREYIINNLYINQQKQTATRCGLFSTNYGTIQNIGLLNVSIKTSSELMLAGAVTGQNREDSMIRNCLVSGNIQRIYTGGVAGVVGHNIGTIEQCYNKANISIKVEEDNNLNANIGGIVGSSSGEVSECFNSGNIQLFVKGTINNRTIILAGGVGSTSSGNMNKCANIGDINAETLIEGEAELLIQIGGVTAALQAQIQNCYNRGDITVKANQGELDVGGVAGKYMLGGTINNSYNTGIIEWQNGGTSYVGGISARMTSNITNSYYLDNSDFTNTNENAGKIKSMEEMKTQEFVNLLNTGLSELVWEIKGGENDGYPTLIQTRISN